MKQKEKDTTEIIDKKKEIAIVVAMAVLFAVLVRVTQMDEIRRIFYLNDECMWKFHTILVVSFFVSIVWFGFFLWIIFEIGRWNTEKYKCFVRNFVIYFIIQFVITTAFGFCADFASSRTSMSGCRGCAGAHKHFFCRAFLSAKKSGRQAVRCAWTAFRSTERGILQTVLHPVPCGFQPSDCCRTTDCA